MKPQQRVLLALMLFAVITGCAGLDDLADRYGKCDGFWHGDAHASHCGARSIRDAV